MATKQTGSSLRAARAHDFVETLRKTPSDLAMCRRVAHILGESCGAARAIREHDRRLAAGEDADVVSVGKQWIVFDRRSMAAGMVAR